MSLRDLIKRLRSGYENASDSLAEQVNRARTYLDENAPGLESGAQSLARFIMHASPATAGQAWTNDITGSGDARLRYTLPTSVKDAVMANPLVADVANAGNQLVGEPVAYGINRIPAIGNDQLQIGDKTVNAGGPWSGLQRQALLQGGANAGGAADVAAKAGVTGINIATNPLTYMPTGNAPLLAQLGLGTLGVGGFGGASAPAQVARAFAGGAGMAAGSDIAGSVTGGNPLAELAGGFAGAALAHRAGAATPGLSGLFKDAEGAAVQRPRNPMDLLRPPSVVPVDIAKTMGDVRLPNDARFQTSVQNTPGAMLTDDGLLMDVRRFQRPDAAGRQSPRDAVYYTAPEGPLKGWYGGGPDSQEITGTTLFRRPLVVDDASYVAESAYGQLTGKANAFYGLEARFAMADIRSAKDLASFYMKYGIPEDRAGVIARTFYKNFGKTYKNSNMATRWALEPIVAEAARQSGYDSIIGIGEWADQPLQIGEIMDLRESANPSLSGYKLHPTFQGITEDAGRVRGGPLDMDALRAADAGLAAETPSPTRMYHGTGGVYAAPDATRMSAGALFEDGLYLTSSPEVSSSYAEKARTRFHNPDLAPNVRPVDVPPDINLLNMDAPLPPGALDDLIRAMPDAQVQGDPAWFRENVQRELDRRMQRSGRVGETPTYADLYKATQAFIGVGSGDINRAIANLGYDGVRYDGGLRTPLRDVNGQSITHDAMVIFPEAWPRLRNAIDGSPLVPADAGVPDPTVALHAGIPLTKGRAIGAILGGTAGALWPADSPEEREKNMAKGLGMGLTAAVLGPKLITIKNTVLTPAALRDPQVGAMLVRYNNAARSVAATEANRYREAIRPLERTLAQSVQDGNITLNAQGRAAVNQAIADARQNFGTRPIGDAAVKRIQDNTYASALVGEHPEYYDLATPEAQGVVNDIRTAYDTIYAKAAQNGVEPAQTRANYINRAWDVPQSGSAAVKGKPLGAAQSYMKEATFDDFLQGLSEGYVPKSLNVSDLIAQHAAAVETAIAQKKLIDTITGNIDMHFNPRRWDAQAQQWVNLPVPEGYRAYDAPAFRKMFGTINTAAAKQAIADFETNAILNAAPDPAARAALLHDLRDATGTGRTQLYLRDDVAQALDAAFAPAGDLARKADSTLGVAREAALGADVAMAGRVTPSMWLQAMAGSNPLTGTAAIGKALWWSINPRAAQEARLSPTWQRWAPHFGNVGPHDLGAVLDQLQVENTTLRRVPFFGKPLQWMEDWQFNTLIPNLEVATAEAIYRRKAGQVGKLGEDAVRDAIAARVETVAAGVSRMRAGTSRDQEALLRGFLLSPNFTRGALRTIQMLGTPGIEGDLARKQAALMATTGLALVTGLSMAFQGDVSLDALDRIANPTNPDSVTNPRSRNFMKIVLGDGTNVDVWGQFTPVFRAMLKPFAAGIGAGNEAYQHPQDGQNPLYNAVSTGLHAAFGMDGTEPWRDWAENRLSIPLAAGRNLFKNEDMLGNAITNAEDGDTRQLDRLKYVGKQFLPGVADVGLATDTGAQPEYEVSPDSVQKGVGQVFGINVTPGPNDPAAVTDKVSAFLQQNGVAPGVDPLTSYRRAINDKNVIPIDVAARFRADNPNIDTYIADTRAKREALKQQPVGPEAAREYNTARANAQAQRTAALQAAAAQYAQDHDGNAYRKAVERAWTLYQGGLQTSAKTILGVDTLADAQARIDKAYGGKDPSSAPAARAFDEYESMRVPDNATSDQRDMALEARRLFLAPGGTADQKYGAGTGDILQRTIRDRYRAEGGETYAQYFDAQQTMGQYAAISPYIGMDARTARRAGAALDRARALQQYGLVPSPILALFQDTEIDPATRLAALRILRYGKSMVNPQRMMFRWQNPKMLTFYGDLNNEDYNRLTGAA